MPSTTETARLIEMAGLSYSILYIEGSTSPTTTMMSIVEERPAESLLNLCSLYFSPPKNIERPMRSRTLNHDGADHGSFDQVHQPLAQGKDGDKKLDGVTESGVYQGGNGGGDALGDDAGRLDDDVRDSNDGRPGDEGNNRVEVEVVRDDGNRDEDQKGHQGRESGKTTIFAAIAAFAILFLTTRGRWRRGWDSNPRSACTDNGFQDRHHRPLGHPSMQLVPNKHYI